MAKKVLTPEQIVKIKDSLEDVTYTFHDTPVLYKQAIQSIDRFQEDRELVFNDFDLMCFREDNLSTSGKISKQDAGALQNVDVKLTFNARDLLNLGLLDLYGNSIIKAADDYLVLDGQNYRIEKVYNDGKFDTFPILIIILANLVEE